MTEDGDANERRTGAAWLGAALAALGPLLIALAVLPAYPALGAGAGLLQGALSDRPGEVGAQPLAALAARALGLLPLGPLALRATVSAAVLLALAAGALYLALDEGLRALGLRRALLASPLALGGTWLAFGCVALAPSAVHVHAAALALAALALERMVAALGRSTRAARACVRVATLWLALLLVEQPQLAFALALGAAPALVLGLGERGALPTRWSALWPALLVAPFAAWAWHASPVHPLAPLALHAPSLASLRELGAEPVARTLLAAGAIGLLTARTLRGPFGVFVGVGAVLALASTVAVDAEAATQCLLPLAAALSAGAVARALGARHGLLAHGVTLAAVALGLSHLQTQGRRALAHDGSGNDLLRDAVHVSLPARALVFPSAAGLRAQRAAELEQHVRPDVALVPAPWRLDLPGASVLEREHPELRAVLRAQLLSPSSLLPELQAVAAERPVLLELDPAIDRELRAALVPYGLLQQLVTSEVSKSDLRVAGTAADARLDRLSALLDPERALPELRAALRDALKAAAEQSRAAGDPDRALRLAARAGSWSKSLP